MRRWRRYIIIGWMVASMSVLGQTSLPGQTGVQTVDTAGLSSAYRALLDSAAWWGLDSVRYQPYRAWPGTVSSFLKALQCGERVYDHISFDGVTRSFDEQEDSRLTTQVAALSNADDLRQLVSAALAPRHAAFDTLLAALSASLTSGDTARIRQLNLALNLYRWIHHHPFPRYIVVNIASATLRYYEADTVRLQMRVIAGRPSTRTPRFAAWCDHMVLYPYWNVPRKIAVNEFLPMFRRAPAMVDILNMQLLDAKGRVVDPSTIQWQRWNKKDFPYAMRQSTGCDNALGVLKFDLNSPFDVYMHDTNLKGAFIFPNRYLSHGCIRLEKPFELGVLLEPGLDTAMLAAGLKNQQPETMAIRQPVPVFVVYLTADVDNKGKLAWFRDIYHLL